MRAKQCVSTSEESRAKNKNAFFVALPHDATGLSAVCHCGIS